jgi:protein-tyrosine phosphatase
MEPLLKSQPNFRDLGGVMTKTGQKVKAKKIFRSGYLGKIDDQDLSILKKLRVNDILDLRTTQEIELIGQVNYPDFIVYQNIGLNAGNITKSLIPIFQKGEFHLLDPNLLNNIYADLITKFNHELADIFRVILNANHGVVYHCSHGKDRTGLVSALLLEFFGVDRDHIYDDYLKSNALLKKQNDAQLQTIKANFIKKFNREVSDEEFNPVKSLFYCRTDLLKTVFDYIDNEFITVTNYLESALGLSNQELELLKTKYLE